MQGEGFSPSKTHKSIAQLDADLMRVQKSTRASIPAMVGPHDLLRQKYRWYYNWHMSSWANFVHWSVLIGYTSAACVLLVAILVKGPVSHTLAASKQTWSTTSDWKTWKLEGLVVTDKGLVLAHKTSEAPATVAKTVKGISIDNVKAQEDSVPDQATTSPVTSVDVPADNVVSAPTDQTLTNPVESDTTTAQSALADFNAKVKCFFVFRVGEFDGWEIPIYRHLIVH